MIQTPLAMNAQKASSQLVEVNELKKAALHFRAINHTLRQQILYLLHKNQSMKVTDIYEELRLEQSVASQHLAILRKANLVMTTRQGKNIFYSVNYERLNLLHTTARNLLK